MKCYCFDRYNLLYFTKLKATKLFYLHCSWKTLLSKLGEFKKDQKYFVR